jgi:hypothetical protein
LLVANKGAIEFTGWPSLFFIKEIVVEGDKLIEPVVSKD